MKVLLAVDGSSFTKKMLAYLVTHAELLSGDNEFHVLTVLAPLPPRARAVVGKEIADKYHDDEAERILATVTKFLTRHGIAAKVSWKAGSPAEQIAAMASKGRFDLLLMGSHGHGALGNLVLGSVATGVLARSKTPVLLVR